MSDTVYAIAQVSVKDYGEYVEKYALATGALITQFGGEVLVATPAVNVVEGEWSGNWTVLFRFPDQASMTAFYTSDEYAPLKKARVEQLASHSNIVVAPAFDPSAM